MFIELQAALKLHNSLTLSPCKSQYNHQLVLVMVARSMVAQLLEPDPGREEETLERLQRPMGVRRQRPQGPKGQELLELNDQQYRRKSIKKTWQVA